ncbi:MAG TPA: peptidylprolyl isomerase, partial [Planctomycetaceae bacterium]|nr:peptidylprolyl isomerase [Planctomycetaceae bacterium]
PLQALTLLNDPVYVEAAKSMATRVLTERAEATVEEQLTFAFRLATSRAPDDREQAILLNLLETQKSLKRDDALKKNPPAPQGVSAADYRAWVSVTTALINLHETIMHH